MSFIETDRKNRTSAQSSRRGLIAGVVLSAMVTFLGACGGTRGSAATSVIDASCMGTVSDRGPTVALVIDGRSASIDNFIQTIENSNGDPAVAWRALSGTTGRSDPSAPTESGIVMVAVPDAHGNVEYPVTVDLRGAGVNSTVRSANARFQTRCLAARLSALPAPVAPVSPPTSTDDESAPPADTANPGPAIVTSLAAVASRAREQAGDSTVTVTVQGLGRSSIVGRPWVSIGLKDDQRPQVFSRLADAGLDLPSLKSEQIDLNWMAPGEGAPDEIIASQLNALAKDLCDRMHVTHCEVTR